MTGLMWTINIVITLVRMLSGLGRAQRAPVST